MTAPAPRSELLSIVKRLLLDSGVMVALLGIMQLLEGMLERWIQPASGATKELVRQRDVILMVDHVFSEILLVSISVFLALEMAPIGVRIWKYLRGVGRDADVEHGA